MCLTDLLKKKLLSWSLPNWYVAPVKNETFGLRANKLSLC